jgi:predicted AlkP superfamily pyrophosphatase or phosphodiesterase
MASSEKRSLLADKEYDRDAAIVDSDPEDSQPGSDVEDGALQAGDDEVLNEAEEQERLLTKPSRFGANVFQKSDRREARRKRRASRRSQTFDENGQVMFEMEGGFKDTSSEDSVDLSEKEEYRNRKPRRGRMLILHLMILGLFVAFAYGAWKASKRTATQSHLRTYWNGTHTFKPTTILISLDGFRADFLNRGLTPALSAFVASGVSPRYMLPSFPSVTFPNHFTLVTGLYPESHGIVSNQFWDPELQEEFHYTNVKISMQPKWWNAEPLWVTAEKQGARTAVHMWPGSEAHIPDREPTYIDKYNGSEALPRKVDRLMTWLDMPGDDDEFEGDKRPQLMLAYVPNVDADGHKYGPNSTEIRGTISDVDSMLTMIVEGLVERNLTEIVNLVIVSDHGMATTSAKRIVQLDDIIDMSLVDHMDGWPLRGLRLKHPDRDVPILYEQLLAASKQQGSFDVYTLETMPERYHFSKNDRIAPLWIVPKTGWAVLEKEDFDVAKALETGESYNPKGLHGYDHEHPLMRAIFVARGPAFPHPGNSRIANFQNIEVYNIVCESIGVHPVTNNGSLHLPLRIEGLHSDEGAPVIDTPHDADEDADTTEPPDGAQNEQSQETNTTEDGASPADEGKKSWLQFLKDGIDKAKEWAKQFAEALKGNHPGDKVETGKDE